MNKQGIEIASRDSKRLAILEAGMKVLGRQGVSNTSMNDIVRESGLSKGGVYHYFASKDMFLVELWNYFFERYAIANISALQDDENLRQKPAIEQIEVLITQHESVLDDMGKDIGLMMDLYIEAIHNPALKKVFNQQYNLIIEIITSLIKSAQEQGDIDPKIDSMVLSCALLAIFDGFGIAQQIREEKTLNYPRMALDAARIMLKGVRLDQ